MTREEMLAEADRLEAAARTLRQAVQAEDLTAETTALGERLVYAAEARCACAAGLAHDPTSVSPAWTCSAVLLRHLLPEDDRIALEAAYHPAPEAVAGSAIEAETETTSTRPVAPAEDETTPSG